MPQGFIVSIGARLRQVLDQTLLVYQCLTTLGVLASQAPQQLAQAHFVGRVDIAGCNVKCIVVHGVPHIAQRESRFFQKNRDSSGQSSIKWTNRLSSASKAMRDSTHSAYAWREGNCAKTTSGLGNVPLRNPT